MPKKAVSEITMIRPGKAISMSTIRWTSTSNQPPNAPLTRPTAVAMTTPSATEVTLTPSEARPPYRTRVKTSRPSASVPIQ